MYTRRIERRPWVSISTGALFSLIWHWKYVRQVKDSIWNRTVSCMAQWTSCHRKEFSLWSLLFSILHTNTTAVCKNEFFFHWYDCWGTRRSSRRSFQSSMSSSNFIARAHLALARNSPVNDISSCVSNHDCKYAKNEFFKKISRRYVSK